ncbi:rho GTPase-activating protein 28 [Lampris incognitus]|uniref:rho GTPase-activating protein 28 n=1 Tax=Lampris incognitus TaxID=2546036 RepID=UPI0024B5BBD7|nr:rho GTPase-activating protein 28 [Lampris incognitus]
METILEGLPKSACQVYLDDLMIHTSTFERELANLRDVLGRLRQANLKLHPQKCQLFQRQTLFLGHMVSGAGIATNPEKVKDVAERPQPENVPQLKSFLGLANYYRRFVRSYADIASPLHQAEMVKPFLWTEECSRAFVARKEALVTSPVLAYPLPDCPFILDTDASDKGVGEYSHRKGSPQCPQAEMQQYHVGDRMERVAVDILGPLPLSEKGSQYILVAMDYFCKWPESYAIPNQETTTVAEVLVDGFVTRLGVPDEIHSDQGRNFESQVFKEMCRLLHIKKTHKMVLHPQSDGMVEWYNHTLLVQLAVFVQKHQRDWDDYLQLLMMAYRSAMHQSTGCTPASIMFGQELHTPTELLTTCQRWPSLECQVRVGIRRDVYSYHKNSCELSGQPKWPTQEQEIFQVRGTERLEGILDGMLSFPVTPPPTTANLQPGTMEACWSEVRSTRGEEEEEDGKTSIDGKSIDKAELEEAWLAEAGLSSLVTGCSSGEGPAEALLSTLTRQQVATVKQRLDNYHHTLRRRHTQAATHVRDIFATAAGGLDSGASSTPCNQECPPVRLHSTTKPLRRTKTRVRPTFPIFTPLEDNESEHGQPPTHTYKLQETDAQTDTHSTAHSPRRADWLLRDAPYSEGVAEHGRGGACQDCQHLHGDDHDLSSFQLVCPQQGLTRMEDLSPADMTKVGHISLIELGTFYRTLGIHIRHRRPHRTKPRDRGVFGVPLMTVLENDRKWCPGEREKVPLVFRKLLCILEQTGLQTEGILRVPGSAARLKYLREELDRKLWREEFDWSSVRHQEAAGLLKMFIRELPTPLLTSQHLPAYTAALGISSPLHQVQALHLLILLLPEANRHTLKALLGFLSKVVAHQEENRMSAWNVSMVIAPNLFTRNHCGKNAKKQEEMQEAVGAAHLVHLMITHQEVLWTVPCFLLSQVRQMNQATCQKQTKTKTRLMRRKNKNNENEVTELCAGLIRVHAPQHNKVSMAIQLDGQTKAKDITARFELENRSSGQRSGARLYLFEVGGNIGERRLHPDSVLLDIYHVNPHCEWILKPRDI